MLFLYSCNETTAVPEICVLPAELQGHCDVILEHSILEECRDRLSSYTDSDSVYTFFNNCEMDLCHKGWDWDVVCDTITSMVEACLPACLPDPLWPLYWREALNCCEYCVLLMI